MNKKVMIAVGGTGGHVFPAIALAKQLINEKIKVLFLGGGLTKNKYFSQSTFPFHEVVCSNISLAQPWRLPPAAFSIFKGTRQSRKIIQSWQPDVAVGFGSFYTVPPLLAAKWCGIPLILHAADLIPGKVIKLFAPYAVATGVNFPNTPLKGKVVEVGIPLREGYRKGSLSKEEACRYYKLDPTIPTILVFGGSQGAQAINSIFFETATKYLQIIQPFQVIHLTGDHFMTNFFREGYTQAGLNCCVKEFEPAMNYAWSAADFVVSRAGAASIAEQIEYEVPGILIPYPFAMDNHQEANADMVEQKIGIAIKCAQKELSAKKLAEVLSVSFLNRLSMQRNAQIYKQNHRRTDLCALILSHLEENTK